MSQHDPQVLMLNLEKSSIIPSERTIHPVHKYNQGCTHLQEKRVCTYKFANTVRCHHALPRLASPGREADSELGWGQIGEFV